MLTFGSETWTINKKGRNKLEATVCESGGKCQRHHPKLQTNKAMLKEVGEKKPADEDD